ncbi:MAG: hypothetical protein HZB12_02460, partial [Candidatus Yonathbacteria bacterium]|nr:hypothetical protein [Candidatus Yonathbacteria bacterium]
GAKSDAKERIIGALIGLGLILTSWLILNSINPNLVNFNLNLPAVGETTTAGGAPGAVPPTGPCSVTPLTPLSDSSVIAMENGAAVVWTSKDPNVNNNLIKLQAEFYKLDNALMLKDYGSGVTLTVNSAYRPIEYQKHLWEIWNKWKNQGLETSTNPNCATLKNEVGAEYSKHGLGSLVGSPNGCAPHVKGTGIDIRITNGTFSSSPSDTSNLLGINAFMQTAPPPSNTQIDLMWQGISGDEVHFNLKNPPYTGCATI